MKREEVKEAREWVYIVITFASLMTATGGWVMANAAWIKTAHLQEELYDVSQRYARERAERDKAVKEAGHWMSRYNALNSSARQEPKHD